MSIIGYPLTASVTTWGSAPAFHSRLISYNCPTEFTITSDGSTFDATCLTSPLFKITGKSLKGAKGTFSAHLGTPQDGSVGLVTYASGYAANINSWEITITRELADVTDFGSSWRKFVPGRVSWKGTYKGFQDASIAPFAPLQSAEPASATFQVITGAGGRQLVGTIVSTQVGEQVKLGSVITCDYAFEGSDKLTNVGTATQALWPADSTGALLSEQGTSETLTLTPVTGTTISGFALWDSIKITNTVGSPVKMDVSFTFNSTVTGLT